MTGAARSGDRPGMDGPLLRSALAVCFLALAAATLVAHRNPATGYEQSVYAGTPLAVWIGLEVAFAAALIVALLAGPGRVRGAAVALGGGATTLVAGLPVVRGYHYYGGADSLTHLGYAREVLAGELSPLEIIYPGIHSFGVLLTEVAGFELTHSLMLVVLAFAVLYLAFATLAVRLLTGTTVGTVIGAFAAFFLVPVNHVVTALNPHPITQASMFFALVLFLLVKFAFGDPDHGTFAGAGALLALTSVSVVLYHPQQAAVVVLFFGTVAAFQFARARLRDATRARPLYGQTAVAAAAFLVWIPFHGAITRQMRSIVVRMSGFLLGTSDASVGSVVDQRGASLTTIGSGIGEIFVKLFLVSAVLSALAGLLFLATLWGRIERPHVDRAVRYLFAGLLTLGVFGGLHFVGNLSELFFRYFAMIMVAVSVLGAVQFARAHGGREVLSGGRFAAVGLAVCLLLALSAATLYSSPFIYQASEQKTQMQLEGYEATFETVGSDADPLGVGYATWRYRHAVYGPTGLNWSSDSVPPPVLRGNLTSHYGEGRYVVLTEFDRQRETTAYRGIQYSERDLARLEQYDGVHRVRANGEVDLYYVSGG
ncbi:hypothetical protein [Halostella litorea]|uniref:hypothetical protein n=1 Tax=Halostella litorea TaxID=2528831 RepID=UPI00109280FD|nr:hypothetical protein [Halostella litorea]